MTVFFLSHRHFVYKVTIKREISEMKLVLILLIRVKVSSAKPKLDIFFNTLTVFIFNILLYGFLQYR